MNNILVKKYDIIAKQDMATKQNKILECEQKKQDGEIKGCKRHL